MKLVIYGFGGHGIEVEALAKSINKKNGRFEEIIFADDSKEKIDEKRIFSFEYLKKSFSADELEFMVGIGEPKIRELISDKIRNAGFHLSTLIHETAYIADDVLIEEGVMVGYNAYVSVGSKLLRNALVQPLAVISHECTIGENTVVASHVSVGGLCTIGKNTFLGLNSSIRQGLSIGNNSIVGMGSVVIRDVGDRMLVLGNPAKVVATGELRALKG